jgi:hypothetical protein
MKLFSQRKGIKPIKTSMQVDNIDGDLRVGLWNVLTEFYWQEKSGYVTWHYPAGVLLKNLQENYFKEPLDILSNLWQDNYSVLRAYFFKCPWNEVYDFIEFIVNNSPDYSKVVTPKFITACNAILERELSAYRLVGGQIIQITSEQEISAIEEALEATNSFRGMKVHLTRALELFADRKLPDYRNSIKESISAVEAVCKLISNDDKATLDKALDIIKDLHPALKRAFSNLYGYTSDAQGIRHALLDEPSLGFEDAKFMLVSCSAFINYLISKASKAGVKV